MTECDPNLSLPSETPGGIPKPKRRVSLVTNVFSNWSSLVLNIAIAFFLTPYVIATIGTANYGIWVLVISIVGYYGLLDLGVRSAILRYVALNVGKGDRDELNRVINTALAIFTSIGVFLALLSLVVAEPLANFFDVAPEDYEAFKQVVRLLGVASAATFPANVLSVAILGHERFVTVNAVRICVSLIRGGLTLLVLYRGHGLVGIGWVHFCLGFFRLFVFFTIVKMYFPYIHFMISGVGKTTARVLVTFGFFTLVWKLGTMMRVGLHAPIIGKFLDMEMVGVYGVAIMLLGYVLSVVVSCCGVTQPRLAALAGAGDPERFRESYLRYSVVVSVMAAGIGLLTVSLAGDFLTIWLPPEFKDPRAAAIALYILVLGLLAEIMTTVSINGLQAVNKHRFLAYQTLVEGVVNLGLTIYLLTRFPQLGILGAALGAAVPSTIGKIFVQPVYSCRILQVGWGRYMVSVLVKPFLVFGLLFLLSEASRRIFFAPDSYFELAAKGIVLLGLYTALSYAFCLDPANRRALRGEFDRILCSLRRKAGGAKGNTEGLAASTNSGTDVKINQDQVGKP